MPGVYPVVAFKCSTGDKRFDHASLHDREKGSAMSEKSILPDNPNEDEFLTSLRINQSFTDATYGARKLLMTVPVRKPMKTEFFRVHHEHWIDCHLVELRQERELYFALPEVAPLIAEFVEPVRLRLCITRQGTPFLWPLRLPKDDRRGNTWHQSALEAAALAEKNWVRIVADMGLGAYQPFVADKDLGDPKWPEEPWADIVKIALKKSVIDSEDHPVVQQLLGRA
jgi:hypothetical protein